MCAASIIEGDMGRCGSGAAETAWSPGEQRELMHPGGARQP